MIFILLSMVVALITGWVFDRLVTRKILPANPHQYDLPDQFAFWQDARKGLRATNYNWQFFKEIIVSGITDSRIVVRWLLLGILLAAILRVVLDVDQFESLFGPTLIGLLATVFTATILEVCSEGTTPIAADIFNRANAPGNGFAFLMAGVATDYTEIMVLKDTTNSLKICFVFAVNLFAANHFIGDAYQSL